MDKASRPWENYDPPKTPPPYSAEYPSHYPPPYYPTPGYATDRDEFVYANEEAKQQFGRFNLLLVGQSGVGKSSLVNAVFGRPLARVGLGMPVTKSLAYYQEGSLGIWDSKGLEIGTPDAVKKIRDDLAEIARRPNNEQVSVVWYAMLAKSHRMLTEEIALIRELASMGMPVIIVLTKVHWVTNKLGKPVGLVEDEQAFYEWLSHAIHDPGPTGIPARAVIPTSTVGTHGKGKGHGLSELVSETLTLVPEGAKDAFRIAQHLYLPWKRQMARKITAGASAAALAAAATPIPVADAAVLAPLQIAMMGRIAAVYELELKSMLSAGTLAQFSAQLAGRALARSFVKLVPGVGSVINSTVASALTATMGEGWMRLCEQVYIGKLQPQDIEKQLKNYAPTIRAVMVAMAGRKLFRR